MQHALIHQALGKPPGNYTVTRITPDAWGTRVIIELLYRYPPEEKPLRLIFEDCRSQDWYMQKSSAEAQTADSAQLMTHDLGLPDYARTARFATTMLEIILSYRVLRIEQPGANAT